MNVEKLQTIIDSLKKIGECLKSTENFLEVENEVLVSLRNTVPDSPLKALMIEVSNTIWKLQDLVHDVQNENEVIIMALEEVLKEVKKERKR